MRPFVFVEGGIGFYGNDFKKDFWTKPLSYFAGFGVGSEAFVAKNWSFYLDTGLNQHFFDDKNFPFQKFTMGMRFYL